MWLRSVVKRRGPAGKSPNYRLEAMAAAAAAAEEEKCGRSPRVIEPHDKLRNAHARRSRSTVFSLIIISSSLWFSLASATISNFTLSFKQRRIDFVPPKQS